MLAVEWFDGVYLLGRFSESETGGWLLAYGDEAAVLELPPHEFVGPSPAEAAVETAGRLGVRVTALLCTHAHGDHFCAYTLAQMREAFPDATPWLQEGFRRLVSDADGVHFFDKDAELSVGGEPLYLVHAPKHSGTDTMVIFRGAACTGDWELGTLRSVHDDKKWARVPVKRKLASVDRLAAFPVEHGYRIHRTYSAHANHRREEVDWASLMAETRQDRELW